MLSAYASAVMSSYPTTTPLASSAILRINVQSLKSLSFN
jgi:hypothetical protein